MPVIRSLMKGLKKQYGGKKGEDVYFAMENKAGGSPTKLRQALKVGAFARPGLRSQQKKEKK